MVRGKDLRRTRQVEGDKEGNKWPGYFDRRKS